MAAALGCSKAKELPVPVAGVVTYNGTPLVGATVSFLSTDAQQGRLASGLTDEQGRFQLHTFLSLGQQAAGAVPGTYKVAIHKREAPNVADSGAASGKASADSAPRDVDRATPPAAERNTPSEIETSDPSLAEISTRSDAETPVPSANQTPKAATESATEPSGNRSDGAPQGGMGGRPGSGAPQGKSLIPEKYGNPDESGLTAVVKPESNQAFRYDLTDDPEQ